MHHFLNLMNGECTTIVGGIYFQDGEEYFFRDSSKNEMQYGSFKWEKLRLILHYTWELLHNRRAVCPRVAYSINNEADSLSVSSGQVFISIRNNK